MEEALRRAKDPTSDTYKSPFEKDWVAQNEKAMKRTDIAKRRRTTVIEEICNLNFAPSPSAYKIDY